MVQGKQPVRRRHVPQRSCIACRRTDSKRSLIRVVRTPQQGVQIDPTGAVAYFITTRGSPLERQIDRLDIATGELTRLSTTPGFHALALSADGGYLVCKYGYTHHASDFAALQCFARRLGVSNGL